MLKKSLQQVVRIAGCWLLLLFALPAAAQKDSVAGYFEAPHVVDFISSCFSDTYDSARVFKLGIYDSLCLRNAFNTAGFEQSLYTHCYTKSRLPAASYFQRLFSQKLIYANAIRQPDGNIMSYGCPNAFDNDIFVFLFFDGASCVLKLGLFPDSKMFAFYYEKNGVSCYIKESCINDIGWQQFHKLFGN